MMENWEKVREKCDKVLQHDPENLKAKFRRGKANRMLGNYELAKDDLQDVKNVQGQHELKLLEKAIKKEEKRQFRYMKKAFAADLKKQKEADLKNKKKNLRE